MRGISLIKKWEGLRLAAYQCSANVWTIGYGSTFYENGQRVKKGDVITVQMAERLLAFQYRRFENEVKRLVTSNINENQLAALTSFAFNAGTGALQMSTLLRKVNANPNDPTIRDEFMRWTRAGGRVLNGLVNRRKDEANLYFS